MDAVRANVAAGNRQIRWRRKDLVVWRTAGRAAVLRPDRSELLDLFTALVDRLIAELSACCGSESDFSSKRQHIPEHRALAPLIGIETGSVRIARHIHGGKAMPFDIKDWPTHRSSMASSSNRHNGSRCAP